MLTPRLPSRVRRTVTAVRLRLKNTLRALLLVTAPLVLPSQSLAQGDDTNAAKITDLSLWADMYQVMGGTSPTGTPDEMQDASSKLKIRTPKGIYAYVLVDDLDAAAQAESVRTGKSKKDLLINYFRFMLSQQEVAGVLFAASWGLLNPNDPAGSSTFDCTSSAYDCTSLDAAFEAIEKVPAKKLQLNVTAGFNSPPWLFQPLSASGPPGPGYLASCDGLFTNPPIPTSQSCGYTDIFIQTEVSSPGPARLPLPWSKTYQDKWKEFTQRLWWYINTKGWQQHVVSVALAGPTATSSEIMLPNDVSQGTGLQVASLPAGYATNSGIDFSSAWNCLLANNYGVDSSYLNSNRAFVEAWATAIDMFGEVFSEVTLVVTTANGLPEFEWGKTSVAGCNLTGIKLPTKSTPGYAKLLKASPVFEPDCGRKPLRPMDCAAEAAILAYFAEPPVGGPNAKATQENALSASDDVVPTLRSLSNASVKWLAKVTEGGLFIASSPPLFVSIDAPLVSRMLGGLQFQHMAADSNKTAAMGCPQGACGTMIDMCAKKQFSTSDCHLLDAAAPVERALLNSLKIFFAGTSGAGASTFGAPDKIANNDFPTPVKGARLDYLQIWAGDIKYAAGYGHCVDKEIMTEWSPTQSAPPACYTKQTQPMPTVEIEVDHKKHDYDAKGLLKLASQHIPTSDVALPLFGPNTCGNKAVPKCKKTYFHRGAFGGDIVCVSKKDETDARNQTDNGRSNEQKLNHYATNQNATDYAVTPVVPYGRCETKYYWRGAYMGDYVCVTKNEWLALLHGNAVSAKAVTCP
jgi:hypothetical protein